MAVFQKKERQRDHASRRAKRSIFVKQLLSYLLIILLISGIISAFFFSTAREHLESEIGKKLQYIARIGARNTPFERLELIRVGDDQSRMVRRLKEKLSEIQEATGVENIFIFRPDMVSLLDLEPELPIGSTYRLSHFKADFLRRLQEGHSVNTEGYISGRDDIFISAYAPIADPQGQLFAIIGVDAGIDELKIVEKMRTRLYWIAFAATAFAALLALSLARSITSPIRHIAQTAECLGRGDYTARASVSAQDEVGLLADAVNRMAQQVLDRDTALKEMAAGVAHEIRNPLNSIKLLVSLLDEEMGEPKTPSQTSTLETLHYEIGKLNRFIDEFLTYARPLALMGDQVEARSMLAGVLEMASAEAREKNIALCHEDGGAPVNLLVDRMRMEQTLLNLVMNAVQACVEGGRVSVRIAGAEGGVDFVVEDTGPGLSPEVLPRLFEPFFTTKIDGTGLGLANARKIAAAHRGEIRAENRARGGARFTLHLPPERLSSGEG